MFFYEALLTDFIHKSRLPVTWKGSLCCRASSASTLQSRSSGAKLFAAFGRFHLAVDFFCGSAGPHLTGQKRFSQSRLPCVSWVFTFFYFEVTVLGMKGTEITVTWSRSSVVQIWSSGFHLCCSSETGLKSIMQCRCFMNRATSRLHAAMMVCKKSK